MQVAIGSVAVAPRAGVLPAVGLLLFGMAMLFGVGFANVSAMHNAAHDTRHATGFPCH